MATDMKESGFEDLIEASLLGQGGYVKGLATDFNREYAVDVDKLFGFLEATQAKTVGEMNIGTEGSSRTSFLFRLRNEITARGVLDVLLKGVDHGAHHVTLFYGTPSALNARASALFEANVFSVTRQLRYSLDDTQHAVDMGIFVNGLPVATIELKNNLTGQTYNEAITQYKSTRSPQELLFAPGRCAVHLAMDEQQAYFCAELKGESSWFLPFNKGHKQGAGNPPNPDGFRTSYVWQDTLARPSLVDIIEHYARKVVEKNPRTKKKTTRYIWPRFHQLEAVRALLRDARAQGAGQRYLIQHSAGSGKSYSITWLAHQLIQLEQADGQPLFHTVIVITDRRVLDRQIRQEIKRFTQVKSVVGGVTEGSKQLREFLEQGKRVITSTIQKFPHILDELGNSHRDKRFALVIDEAHSSQGGKSAAAVNRALEGAQDAQEDAEDKLLRMMQGRKMLGNASYFAFTATPKNKTEELFGTRHPDGSFRPFHSYTMKQAIQEGFIKDVLANYITVSSYYNLIKTVEEDPEFDVKRAQKKLRRYVESHDKPLREKADLMLDHFMREVWGPRLVGGQARAMVVTDGVERVMRYRAIFKELLAERGAPFDVLVAFSGEREWGGKQVTEATLNGFPSQDIPQRLRQDPYRILIVADKFQTGFDEPLLQAMYVDKTLSGVKAVQTLSRLNRAHPDKGEVFVMDFANEAQTIRESFAKYYQTTILSEATDVNKLHDLKRDLDALQVYSPEKVDTVVHMFLEGDPREVFEGILDGCVEVYVEDLDEDEQVRFKGGARSFVRLYNFLSTVLEFNKPQWEKLSIFLNFIIPKLPTPKEEDMSRGVLETIDLNSYRNEVKARQAIALDDADGQLQPVPVSAARADAQTELDVLSNILSSFNEAFGGTFEDPAFVVEVMTHEIPEKIQQDQRLNNALRQGDRKKIALEKERVVMEAVIGLQVQHLSHTEDMGRLLKAFVDNPQHRRVLLNMVDVHLDRAYPKAYINHAGWDELIDLLEDDARVAFARALKAQGVVAPMDVDFEIPGTDNERAFLAWTFDDDPTRHPVGVVDHAVGEGAYGITLIHVSDDVEVEAFASQLKQVLANPESLHTSTLHDEISHGV